MLNTKRIEWQEAIAKMTQKEIADSIKADEQINVEHLPWSYRADFREVLAMFKAAVKS